MSEDRKPRQVAVALDYAAGSRAAPVVVATGRGLVAEQIVAAALENGVAIEANPMLAGALSGVPLDQSIPHELYGAVAEVIGFVLRSRNGGLK
jgi:type III secretion system FlhB-like substrate exporter